MHICVVIILLVIIIPFALLIQSFLLCMLSLARFCVNVIVSKMIGITLFDATYNLWHSQHCWKICEFDLKKNSIGECQGIFANIKHFQCRSKSKNIVCLLLLFNTFVLWGQNENIKKSKDLSVNFFKKKLQSKFSSPLPQCVLIVVF